MKLLVPLFLLMLIGSVSAQNITYVVSYCDSTNSTLIHETILEVSGVNHTTQLDNENCEFGCDAVTDTCKDPSSAWLFGLLIQLSIITVILVSLLIVRHLGDEIYAVGFKFLFLAMSLILLFFLFGVTGNIGKGYEINNSIETSNNMLYSLSNTVMFIVVFVLAIFIFFMIVKIILEFYRQTAGKKIK